jgi:hypothetical protein
MGRYKPRSFEASVYIPLGFFSLFYGTFDCNCTSIWMVNSEQYIEHTVAVVDMLIW